MASTDEGLDVDAEAFHSFVVETGPGLKRALVAGFGVEAGIEATAEAFAYGWEHWERLQMMENPAGYLYRVGQSSATRRDPVVGLPQPAADSSPWIEPGLPAALVTLTEAQRTAVVLVHTFGHSLSEAADILGVSKSSVQTHVDRGLERLRRELGVEL